MKNIYESLIPLIPINLLCYWSDSTIALSWIKSTSKKFELYIDRRVSEIRKLSSPLNWHHNISGSNPTDILSRGGLVSELSKLDFWFCGPKFLCTKFQFDSAGHNSCFVDHADGSYQFCLLARGEECSRELCLTKCNDKIDLQFLNIDKFRNYNRLLNVTALALRFINNLKKSLNQEEKIVQRYVTTEEYSKAECLFMVSVYTTRYYQNFQL